MPKEVVIYPVPEAGNIPEEMVELIPVGDNISGIKIMMKKSDVKENQ